MLTFIQGNASPYRLGDWALGMDVLANDLASGHAYVVMGLSAQTKPASHIEFTNYATPTEASSSAEAG
jgi:hypothetical protein